jgi:hypothetical protein
MQDLLSNEYFMTTVKILLILYASQIAPRAPAYITDLFKNTYVKVALIFLMFYMSQIDFQMSLILAIVIVLGSNVASSRKLMESFQQMTSSDIEYVGTFNKNFKKFGNLKLLESQTEIYPGCLNVKVNDLLAMFNNDRYKLQAAVQSSFHDLLNNKKYVSMKDKERLLEAATAAGKPYNLDINDENAPWIATLLMNYGFKISNTCQPPYNKV